MVKTTVVAPKEMNAVGFLVSTIVFTEQLFCSECHATRTAQPIFKWSLKAIGLSSAKALCPETTKATTSPGREGNWRGPPAMLPGLLQISAALARKFMARGSVLRRRVPLSIPHFPKPLDSPKYPSWFPEYPRFGDVRGLNTCEHQFGNHH